MVFIIGIHLDGGNGHEHITMVQWRQDTDTNKCATHEMIEWLRKGNSAYVSDGVKTVEVQEYKANPPYLRTVADGRWTNNLLALPNF